MAASHARLLGPAEFVSLAEETGDLDAIGCWVLDTATGQLADWYRSMEHCAELWVSVNLSVFRLPSSQCLPPIQRILANPAVPAGKVVIEVSEAALGSDVEAEMAALNALKDLGVRLAVDHFGHAFTSLSALVMLPFDIVKVDRVLRLGTGGQRGPGRRPAGRAPTGSLTASGDAAPRHDRERAAQALPLAVAASCRPSRFLCHRGLPNWW